MLLSLGNNSPLFRFFYNAGLLSAFRYPVQWMLIAVAGLAVLAGQGAERLSYARWLPALIIGIELLATAAGFQPVAGPDYFYRRSTTVEFLQKNQGYHRFVLSPGAEKDRVFKGKEYAEAWQQSRGGLFALTGIPYHLYNAQGTGEPLKPAAIDTLIDLAYSRPTPQSALEEYRSAGVKYLVCRKPLPDVTGYRLESAKEYFIYSLDGPTGILGFKGAPGGARAETLSLKSGQLRFRTQCDRASRLEWRETLFPGWKAFVNGKPVATLPLQDTFMMVPVPAGTAAVSLIYRPFSFMAGVLASLAGTVALFAYAIMRIKRFITSQSFTVQSL